MKKITATKERYLRWYENMQLWRKVEDKFSALYIQQKIRGFLHLYNGQEAILAGCREVVDPSKDKMITAYRNHVQPIAMGVETKYVVAELLGKATGTSGGKGGSMHIFSKEHNFFGGHGIVGGQIPLGAGIAFADKYLETGGVTLAFMGDGAVRQGAFHEALNLAAFWHLPVVYIIENNMYSMGTSVERQTKVTDLHELGCAFDMPHSAVNGMDPIEVANEVGKAIEHARKGNGPTLLEMKTYRYKGHSMSDAQHYRSKEEVAEYQKIDPINVVKETLLNKKWATAEDIKAIDARVKKEVLDAVKFAEDSPFPEPEDLYKGIYKQEDYPFIKE
jgi:pyruvate dehydrogenase E1 component alpha subunit